MEDMPAVDLLVGALDPADGPIERLDTHISTLIFQNEWVYKVKRPVRYEFIDLSTREKRRRICERELELNRRFAPDVYDSLVPIRDAAGIEVDCAVLMHRMPEDRRLSTLVDRIDPRVPDHLRAVARLIATAHARGPTAVPQSAASRRAKPSNACGCDRSTTCRPSLTPSSMGRCCPLLR